MEGLDLVNILGPTGAGALALYFIKRWFHALDQRLNLFDAQLAGVRDRMYNIELKLASLSLDEIKKELKEVHEFRIRKEMEIEALWRSVDPPKRSSDKGKKK